MSNEQGIGAPKGGRVHWLLWCLPPDFKRAYKLYFNYAYHRYCFYRILLLQTGKARNNRRIHSEQDLGALLARDVRKHENGRFSIFLE